jgi:glycosyltransferase involved in cell wall biosynthesis
MQLSFVIPVFNEAESLRPLYEQIVQAAGENGVEFEVILVDDGSRDGSWPVIQELAQRDHRVSGIRFRRNFGKAAAIMAGFGAASGERLLLLDADLQDDPHGLPRFLGKLEAGFDVVNGWKERRLDPWHKVYPSRVFNWMVSRLSGLKLHDHNCGMKLLTREVAQELKLYGELHRFIPVLAHARGFRVTEVSIEHRARQFGHSKYGVKRFARGFLDLLTVTFLTGYGQRPLHLLGGVGLVLLGIGSVGLSYLAGTWIATNVIGLWPAQPIGSRPLLAYSVALTLLGAQALSLGLLAELIVHNTARDGDAFSIAERCQGD